MPGTYPEDSNIDGLQTALQTKWQLYQDCYALTQQIGEAVEADEGRLVLKLLKRRDVIFHKIREVDGHIGTSAEDIERLRILGRHAPAIAKLRNQIQDLIQEIISADSDLYQKMSAKRTEALNELNQNRHKHHLAAAYRLTGAAVPHFINADQ
jgi:ABC-type phosphate transport system auxiliary subunit